MKLTSGEDIRPFDMDELVVQISISEKEMENDLIKNTGGAGAMHPDRAGNSAEPARRERLSAKGIRSATMSTGARGSRSPSDTPRITRSLPG